MKAYWKGTLNCDLLTMPVKLYVAAPAHESRFHYPHASCHTPVEYLRRCPQCDVVVSGEDVVRGYNPADVLVVVTDRGGSLSEQHSLFPEVPSKYLVHQHKLGGRLCR